MRKKDILEMSFDELGEFLYEIREERAQLAMMMLIIKSGDLNIKEYQRQILEEACGYELDK